MRLGPSDTIEIVASEFEESQEWVQRSLVAFLNAEIDLGFTFARTAKIQAQMRNLEEFERAIKEAQATMETIQRFKGKIAKTEMQKVFQERADELGNFISDIEPPKKPKDQA